MTALGPAARDRLTKLLGLLGSDHAGERDAAGLAAMRLLRDHKVTWVDVIEPGRQQEVVVGWRATVAACRRHAGDLRPWELGFLHDIARLPRLSPKQAAIVHEIAERLGLLDEAS